ncbi:CDGSH iron-sulfur domain-containing protein [Quadrisphaera sp. DSM 44207]|uniref:CDGSH iron-sulfur domain-containing protein n=1 Tax=Quadrisphaera sp. DSM 44207 TaxID=1881057 RepID=UPI000890C0D1|nr:CDGSH iron-sulfur domain-containing protein [Quadrisphaera sp. DSM 44207]SDQ39398.1 Iron-binding zinc finger CDGSH type [Quadrisphaera sp. DSM 44207]
MPTTHDPHEPHDPRAVPTGDADGDAGRNGAATTAGATAGAVPPEVSITVCPDGPLLVRGPVVVAGADGRPLEQRRRTMALCRCGATGIAPFCDGSHKVVRTGR